MTTTKQAIRWSGSTPTEAVDALTQGGSLVVCGTKVGYILMASDGVGLERKFEAKQRRRNKPGVVLCASIDQLRELAVLNEEILEFYQRHWDEDILLGCILPWREDALERIPDQTARELVMDARGTSCFVIRFGRPAEQVAEALWAQGKITFASSANPSGIGNRGQITGIGSRIEEAADVIVEADEYVASIQPDKTVETRYEQGVMVSMVDEQGALVPLQGDRRSVVPAPILIRRGLDCDRIMDHLADCFNSWDYRHGQYY